MNIADFFQWQIHWHDDSPFGSVLSGNLQENVRKQLYPETYALLKDAAGNSGIALDAHQLKSCVVNERSHPKYQSWVTAEAFWFPPVDSVTPITFSLNSTVSAGECLWPVAAVGWRAIRAALRDNQWPDDAFIQAIVQTALHRIRGSGFHRTLIKTGNRKGPLYIGHACVSWSDGDFRLWSDPFFRPKSLNYPLRYQPLNPLDFSESNHIVLLTHSHPDHFDPGSLMLFPADTLFLIPFLQRESLLSLDLATRLRQLGFSNIVCLDWGQSYQVGDFTLTGLPFYGEQALGFGFAQLPAAINHGNTYLVEQRGGQRYVLLADSGSDPRMSIRQFARQLRRDHGKIDMIFANHRRWHLYPPQFLLTSVPQYLCCVPDDELSIGQQLMMDPADLATVGEIVGARYAVPYAMGGAYWYEEIGLGYDYLRPQAQTTGFDAHPNELLDDSQEDVPKNVLVKIKKTCDTVILLPGQYWEHDCSTLLDTLEIPEYNDFKPTTLATYNYIGLHIPSGHENTLRDIITLCTLDKHAFFVNDHRMCEIYTSHGHKGEHLRAALAEFARHAPMQAGCIASPLTGKPFSQNKVWFTLFQSLQRSIFHCFRDQGDIVKLITSITQDKPFAHLERKLLAGIAQSLLGCDVRGRDATYQSTASCDVEVEVHGLLLSNYPLALPEQSGYWLEHYGPVDTGLALLLVKLVHNAYWAKRGLKNSYQELEQRWFERVFGDPACASA